MISDRQEKEREIRKEQILKAALKVFKLQGIEKSTMDEIAKQADFGKASLYYYFSSKEEIFVELLDRGWKMIWESIEPVIHNRDHPKDTFINALNIIGGLVRNDSVYRNITSIDLCFCFFQGIFYLRIKLLIFN